MEHLVLDANVLVASFIESESFHDRGKIYIDNLESGEYVFHVPMLVIVEVLSALGRRSQGNRQAMVSRAQQSLDVWEQSGKVVLYPLDRNRMERAVAVAQRHRLRGADAVVASLAEELDMPLKTFDNEILSRFLPASV